MKLAAIDIGSNAIRFQLIRVIRVGNAISFKKLEYIRFPLRLGQDVFGQGKISDATLEKFHKLMHTFKLLIELYEVDGYVGAATSAMREAKNGGPIVLQIAEDYDLKIDIISGTDEADILSKAIIPTLDHRTYLHIDVGGGSTELNVYMGRERVDSQSFQLGSVRNLSPGKRKKAIREMEQWIKEETKTLKPPVTAIGTGGNIRKLFQLSNQPRTNSISLTELNALRAYLNEFSYEQRLSILKMNPDRADVIIPASEIYTEVMKISGADRILTPNVGLKDGLLFKLYEELTQEPIQEVEFLDQF